MSAPVHFVIGQSYYRAMRASPPMTYTAAVQRARRNLTAQAEAEDGEGYAETVIWRPARAPYATESLEPVLSLVVRREAGRLVWTITSSEDLRLRALALLAAKRNEPGGENWVWWEGGLSPLTPNVAEVQYLFRDGSIGSTPRWMDAPWRHMGPLGWDGSGDIIAYRVTRVNQWWCRAQAEGRLTDEGVAPDSAAGDGA